MIDASDILHLTMAEPETSPEHRLGMAIRQAFAALDEIMAMGADTETKHLVIAEQIAMAQLLSRAQLINSFILVNERKFKVVR